MEVLIGFSLILLEKPKSNGSLDSEMAVLDGVNWFCTIVLVIVVVDVVDTSTSQLCFPQKNWNSWFMLLHIVTHSFSGSCDQLVIICSTNNHH